MARSKQSTKQYGMGVKIRRQFNSLAPIDVDVAAEPQDVVCGVTFGDDIEGWRELIARRVSATTTLSGNDIYTANNAMFTGSHTVADIITGDTVVRRVVGDGASIADLPGSPGGISLAEADNRAKMDFLKQAIEAQRALQGLVVLGELRDAINLVRNPLRTLRSYANDLLARARRRKRDRRNRNRKRLRKVMADTWLEWSFGAQPLVNDVTDGAKALTRALVYNPPSRRVAGEGTSEWYGEPFVQNLSAQGITIRCVKQQYQLASVRYYGSVTTSVPLANNWQSAFGVTFSDVLPAVWELIPFSFLVDYFTNAQEIVNAVSFVRGSLTWVNKGTERRISNLVREARPYFSGTLTWRDKILSDSLSPLGDLSFSRTIKSRERYEGSFIPSWQWEIPGFGSKKWLNIAALAAGGHEINSGLSR